MRKGNGLSIASERTKGILANISARDERDFPYPSPTRLFISGHGISFKSTVGAEKMPRN
jgi:hypothetical protein